MGPYSCLQTDKKEDGEIYDEDADGGGGVEGKRGKLGVFRGKK
jgi:hypothetical protein